MLKKFSALSGLSVLCLVFSLSILPFRVASAHEEQRVDIELDQGTPFDAGDFGISMELVDTEARRVLAPADLQVTHEKLLHVFLFDPGLREFRHEHPEFVAGKWILRTQIPVNGNYWLWVQGKLSAGDAEFSSSKRFSVVNGTQENAAPTALGDVRQGVNGTSRVIIENTVLRAGRSAMLNIHFSRTDGTAPELTPYLGALAHVVAVTLDGKSLLHVHPMDAGPRTLMIHTEFHDAGDYRLWIQFMDGGVLKIVPLSVVVRP